MSPARQSGSMSSGRPRGGFCQRIDAGRQRARKSRSRWVGEHAEHLLLHSVDCSVGRFQSAPTCLSEFSLEDALVLRMRTSYDELKSLQFL